MNCSAFPENLLESELFGHVRGAFTGAIAAKPGKFQVAEGGTLLLDEIGEMPLSLQPKLLRVLQEREIDRLGDTHPVPVNVRVIATTNRSLPALIEAGTFRADLYYRLNVIPLSIPTLQQRREDILALAEHFLRKYEPKAQGAALSDLRRNWPPPWRHYDWPGNVRELENFMRRALALTHSSTLGVELFGFGGPVRRRPLPLDAQAGRDPAGPGALPARSHPARHQRQPHAHRGNDGREPAHGAQQDPRVWPGGAGGAYELDRFRAGRSARRATWTWRPSASR